MKHAKRPPAKSARNAAAQAAGAPPTPAAAKAAAPPKHFAPPPGKQPNPRLQADARWQRTQRYGWDKGGSRGGRG